MLLLVFALVLIFNHLNLFALLLKDIKLHKTNSFYMFSKQSEFVQSNLPAVNSMPEQGAKEDYDGIIDYHEDGLHPKWTFRISKTYKADELKTYSPVPKLRSSSDGPGEMGTDVIIPSEKILLMKKLWKEHNLNVMASDMMSLNRSLPDAQIPECKNKVYPKKLPTTSVVIVFHNEARSILLRSIWSVINRAPRELLKEIILVDDFSDKLYLKQPLDEYITTLPVKVELIRTTKREGVVRARLIGAKKAKGYVLTFLDANVECNDGWLEPLLSRIASDKSVIVNPVIDYINFHTMAYNSYKVQMFGFDWDLRFKTYPVPTREYVRVHYDKAAPFRTPTLVGAAFAVDREFFFEIGAFDERLEIWGSENLELSFRTWQCGGYLEIVPCSRIGHLYRELPYSFNGNADTIQDQNKVRVAKVWMDQYKKYFYAKRPELEHVTVNIKDRINLRQTLKCKNFKWFLTNVFPESEMVFGYKKIGQIQNNATLECLDTLNNKNNTHIGTFPCHGEGNSQAFSYQNNLQIASYNSACLGIKEVNETSTYALKVHLVNCDISDNKQIWVYNDTSHQFIHAMSAFCLTTIKQKAYVAECYSFNISQQWKIDDSKKLDPVDANRP